MEVVNRGSRTSVLMWTLRLCVMPSHPPCCKVAIGMHDELRNASMQCQLEFCTLEHVPVIYLFGSLGGQEQPIRTFPTLTQVMAFSTLIHVYFCICYVYLGVA
jgi:hypothetical protein